MAKYTVSSHTCTSTHQPMLLPKGLSAFSQSTRHPLPILHQSTECNIFGVLAFLRQLFPWATSKALLTKRNIFLQSTVSHTQYPLWRSMTTCLLAPTCSQGFPQIAIQHIHQSLLTQFCDTPTKVVTYASDCEYSLVDLRVLSSILKFNAHEFRLVCGQCIASLCLHTLVFDSRGWYCEWDESFALIC